jgi:hypothetical protein
MLEHVICHKHLHVFRSLSSVFGGLDAVRRDAEFRPLLQLLDDAAGFETI